MEIPLSVQEESCLGDEVCSGRKTIPLYDLLIVIVWRGRCRV